MAQGRFECPPGHAHSKWCYDGHGCRCDRCRSANTKSKRSSRRRLRMQKSLSVMVKATPISRRLQALSVIGYGLDEMASITGLSKSLLDVVRREAQATMTIENAQAIVDMYRKLYMTPSRSPSSARVRDAARRAGYRSPLEWANIDRGFLEDLDDGE